MNENKNSTLSVVALILSILGCTFLIGGILAIIDLCKSDGRKKTVSIIALVIAGIWLIVGIIGAAGYGDKDSDKTESEKQEVTAELTTEVMDETDVDVSVKSDEQTEDIAEDTNDTSPENYFKDNVIVVDDYTMKITDWKIIPVGEKGNEYGDAPVIAFWYETTNTSGKDINPSTAWIFIMEAVQDNDPNAINELDVASLPDDQFLDSQLDTIKKDGTVANAVAYKLTDDVTPVELTAKSGMIGDSIGSMIFEIK